MMSHGDEKFPTEGKEKEKRERECATQKEPYQAPNERGQVR